MPFLRSDVFKLQSSIPPHTALSRLGQALLQLVTFIMAPITDQTVNDLKAQVAHLEKRIWELEQRDRGIKPVDAADAMRLILIGPPGAGRSATILEGWQLTSEQAKAHKLRTSRTNIVSATW